MRRRTAVLLKDAVTTVVVVVLVGALVGGALRLATARGRQPVPTTSATTAAPAAKRAEPAAVPAVSPPRPATDPALGVYTGPASPGAAQSFDTLTGGHLADVLDFLPASTWTQLSDPTWIATSWSGTPFRLVLAVPMLPQSGGSLALGAAGDYNRYFSLLAQGLVRGGLGGAVLMVGWQPDSARNAWQVTTAAAAADYVQFWDQIRAAMAGVPGAHFLFEWDAGSPGTSPITPLETYPGDAAVDIIATDAFDVSLSSFPPADQWPALADEAYGPNWIASFASSHHKLLAVAMAGLAPAPAGGSGDNATFLTQSMTWARSAHAWMYVLWDYADWAVTGGGFPGASAAVLQAVGRGTVGATATAPA